MAIPLRILLIDDDEVDRLTVRRLLRQTHFAAEIDDRGDRESAIAAMQPDAFELVLLDYNIPGTDGAMLLDQLRTRMPTAPVIILTGQGNENLAVELMKAGAADYLNKNTLTVERLERSLRYGLALHRAQEERRELLAREQRALEEAQAANRAKDEFLATLSHELRTPLNAILGWSKLLASGSLSADSALRAVEIIERNSRLQAQLIEDLLDISRIITGKLRLDVCIVPLRQVIDAALESVRPSADARQIVIDADVDGPAQMILADPARLQQVVWNLLTNAIKFTPEGGHISIKAQRDGSKLVLSVSDTGSGIDPAFLPFVFDRFRQQDGAATRAHGGLGLGLSIVRHLVELHGGTVEARSAGPGRGSTFLVRLPAAPAHAAVARAVERA